MTRLTFHLILHTHWDREWYLPRAGFVARLVPAVGDVLDMLDREPDTRFVLDGQTIIAEDALAICPEWQPRLSRAVGDRQLEVGPWYILADELVPAGESQIRNLIQGTRDACALGERMDVLYSPDAFGHPAILPSLAGQFGIEYGVAWRGLGRPSGRDRDLHRWTGPDGASMLMYHLPAQGYEIGYDLAASIDAHWPAIRGELVNRAVTSHVAVFLGADHHAPPLDPVAIRDGIHARESGNFVRISSLREFFAAAAPEAATASPITGELRWSYGHTWTLQGTHATRARLKRRHGGGELYLQRQAEPLGALAAWHGGPDQRPLLRTAWRTLLQCQFHDTLCGCCSDLVAQEQESRLDAVHVMAREVGVTALRSLAGHDADLAREAPQAVTPTLLLWNPVPTRRSGIVTATLTFFRRDVLVGPPSGRAPREGSGYLPFALTTHDGTVVPVQLLSVDVGHERTDSARHYPDQDEVDVVQVAFVAPTVPALGFVTLSTAPPSLPIAVAPLVATDRLLENRFVTVILQPDRIELIDRRSGERYVDVLGLVDENDAGDTYTPSIRGAARREGVATTRVVATGPFVAAIERQQVIPSAHGQTTVRMTLLVYADSPLLRVRIELDHHAIDHRLRVQVPIGVGDVCMAGSALGHERRGVQLDQEFPAERPPRTAPAHRYVAAGNGNRGLAILSPVFLEYEWTPEHALLVTLIRAIGELSRNNLDERPGHAGWPMPTPDAQELGAHRIDLAIAPLGEDESSDPFALEQLWEEGFLPMQSSFIRDFVGHANMLADCGVTLEGTGLICSAIKPAEYGAGLVLRCYNVEPAAVQGCWRLATPIARAALLRADETFVAELTIPDPHLVPFTAPPCGMVTILVQRDASISRGGSPARA